MPKANQLLTREAYKAFESETHLVASEVDELATKIRQEGTGEDLVAWVVNRKQGSLTLEQAREVIRRLRDVLYGRRLGPRSAHHPGYPATAWFRVSLTWPSSERTHLALMQQFPRMDPGVRLADVAEHYAVLAVDLYLPFPAGEWCNRPVALARITADAANIDGLAQVENVIALHRSPRTESADAYDPTPMNRNARRTAAGRTNTEINPRRDDNSGTLG